MARGESTFRQRDMTAAMKAAIAAGCQVQRVEVDKTGKIVVILGPPVDPPVDKSQPEPNEWDE